MESTHTTMTTFPHRRLFMKKLALVAIAALIAGQISLKTAPQNAQSQTGTIHGRVVRDGTMDPIPDVQVFMNGTPAAPAASVVTPFATNGVVILNGIVVSGTIPGAATASAPSAITDSGGNFTIR